MELKFKILNKSREGVVVDFIKRGKVKLTWEKFNEKYIITEDGKYAEFNETEKARINAAKEERIAQAKQLAKEARQARKKMGIVYSTGRSAQTMGDHPDFQELRKKLNR